eukprot:scaffold1913_cov257-Pinguiococcus_pyrenoidosus.AAC.34
MDEDEEKKEHADGLEALLNSVNSENQTVENLQPEAAHRSKSAPSLATMDSNAQAAARTLTPPPAPASNAPPPVSTTPPREERAHQPVGHTPKEKASGQLKVTLGAKSKSTKPVVTLGARSPNRQAAKTKVTRARKLGGARKLGAKKVSSQPANRHGLHPLLALFAFSHLRVPIAAAESTTSTDNMFEDFSTPPQEQKADASSGADMAWNLEAEESKTKARSSLASVYRSSLPAETSTQPQAASLGLGSNHGGSSLYRTGSSGPSSAAQSGSATSAASAPSSYSAQESTAARDRFSSAKGISSDAYFNRNEDGSTMASNASQRFVGSNAISSDAYFGRDEGGAQGSDLNDALGDVAFSARQAGAQLANQVNQFMDRVRYG